MSPWKLLEVIKALCLNAFSNRGAIKTVTTRRIEGPSFQHRFLICPNLFLGSAERGRPIVRLSLGCCCVLDRLSSLHLRNTSTLQCRKQKKASAQASQKPPLHQWLRFGTNLKCRAEGLGPHPLPAPALSCPYSLGFGHCCAVRPPVWAWAPRRVPGVPETFCASLGVFWDGIRQHLLGHTVLN